MFEELYLPDDRDRRIFGRFYKPPERFEHGKTMLIASYPQEADGQPVDVYEERMPARFFTLIAHGYVDSVGETIPGFVLTTGSGDEMGKLVHRIALAASQGMIGIKR